MPLMSKVWHHFFNKVGKSPTKKQAEEVAIELHYELINTELSIWVRNPWSEPEYYCEGKISKLEKPIFPGLLTNHIMLPRDYGRIPNPEGDKFEAQKALYFYLRPIAEKFKLGIYVNPIGDEYPVVIGEVPSRLPTECLFHGSHFGSTESIASKMELCPVLTKNQCKLLEVAGPWIHLSNQFRDASAWSVYSDLGMYSRGKYSRWFVNLVCLINVDDQHSPPPPVHGPWCMRGTNCKVAALVFEVRSESELRKMNRYISPYVAKFVINQD